MRQEVSLKTHTKNKIYGKTCELKIMEKVRRIKDIGMIEIIRKKQSVFF